MKAIIIAIVSTEEQVTKGQSIPTQLSNAKEYAKKINLEVLNEYQFDEISTRGRQSKFNKVIEEINKSKEKIALIVEDFDLLQRSFEKLVILDVLGRQGKLEIHFVKDGFVINQNSR